MLLRLFVPSLFFTVSAALYRCIIGVSSENFLIAIEFITSQMLFLGVRMAESFSIVPENIFGWNMLSFRAGASIYGLK